MITVPSSIDLLERIVDEEKLTLAFETCESYTLTISTKLMFTFQKNRHSSCLIIPKYKFHNSRKRFQGYSNHYKSW